MNNLTNIIMRAESDDVTKQNLAALSAKVQYYINIVLGTMAGLLVLAIMIIGAIAWFKASKADSDEERKQQLKKIKWLAGFIVFVVIAWAISGIVTGILQGVWKV
ncbi:Mbov_0395 family pilin-like conjugal transfer protein [Metamycoplasma equirhinis]|uniref:Mbov_0395 family pilin-like conjugal transfer protein n=1 Tax=Metamycoplasma equirhinis TaxID=92402 RepID=UPI003593C8AC